MEVGLRKWESVIFLVAGKGPRFCTHTLARQILLVLAIRNTQKISKMNFSHGFWKRVKFRILNITCWASPQYSYNGFHHARDDRSLL